MRFAAVCGCGVVALAPDAIDALELLLLLLDAEPGVGMLASARLSPCSEVPVEGSSPLSEFPRRLCCSVTSPVMGLCLRDPPRPVEVWGSGCGFV